MDLQKVILNRSLLLAQNILLLKDEYDTAFDKDLNLSITILLAVINNIEYDHADIFENVDEIIKSFSHMIRLIPSDGTMIINKNDHNIKKLLHKGYWSKLRTVDSIKSSGDFNLINEKQYMLKFNNKTFITIKHHRKAPHKCYNCNCGMQRTQSSNKYSNKALSSFRGVSKTDLVCEIDGIKVFDDFAHHPTAIKASINSIKETFKEKTLTILVIFKFNETGVHNAQLVPSLNKSDKA